MKTIGIIGGMSAESTVLYYEIINREINQRLGGNHSAELVMYSLDFERVVAMQKAGNWAGAGTLLANCGQKLQNIGADVLLIATNTMHKVAEDIERTTHIPLLHIVDATAAAITQRGMKKVGLLGTKFTMSDGFYHQRINRAGIELCTPSETQQNEVHRIIFEELCVNKILNSSKQYYQNVINDLKQQGAEGVILGCTEIGLLIGENDSSLPIFDSAAIHALAAVDFALA